jgi:hypothetical protein
VVAQRRSGRGLELILFLLAMLLLDAVAIAMVIGGQPRPGGGIALASPSSEPGASLAPAPSVAQSPPSATPGPTTPPATARPATPSPATPANPTEPTTGQLSAPARAVVSFYQAVVAHDWDRAISLWSPSMQERYPPQDWLIDRFRSTTRIDITRLATVFVNRAEGTARVSVTLVEYRKTGTSPRTFVGAWDLVRIDGRWLLNDPDF